MEVSLKSLISNKLFITLASISLFILLTFQELASYIKFDFNFVLLLLALPFVLKKENNSKSVRYGVAAILLLLLFPFLRLSSVFFFAVICTLLFIYEYQYGKLNSVPLLLVMVISPAATFLSKVLGFEIRLWLTKIAVRCLHFIHSDYGYSGNIILLGEEEFHVDPECMGLRMVLLSMFIVLIFIAYRQQTGKGRVNIFLIILSLLMAYVLVIISNLVRIVLITLFQSPPGTFSHEFIGIICFIVYLVLPLWYLIKKLPVKQVNTSEQTTSRSNGFVFAAFVLILACLFSISQYANLDTKQHVKLSESCLGYFSKDFSCSQEDHHVLKLTNDDYLIYIKPAQAFYSADHSPIICWAGSGYKIVKEQILSTPNNRVYYNELKKDKDVLYSTWWYDSGKDKTISQYKWRIENLIHGSHYHLINVISDNRDSLILKTEKLMDEAIFNQNK